MINSANKYTVSDIFSVDRDIRYIIPKFQREYTWRKENWEELLNDIIESDGNHFIGSIICINKEADALQTAELEVIDGQQRITTISLLYAAIYKLLVEKKENNNEDLTLELGNLKYRLLQKNQKNNPKLQLSDQNNNNIDYLCVLNEIGALEYAPEVKNKGNRVIFKAYRYFLSRLDEFSIKYLTDLISTINSTLLVKIDVSSHSDAFMLFESLNNRGIPLSAIDLIKNKLLSELEKNKKISINEAFKRWCNIIDYLPEYSIQERFLRQFYNAFKFDKNIRVENISKATRSTIIKIYEKLIDRDPQKIFYELAEKSKIYHDFIFPDEQNNVISEDIDSDLKDLLNVQAAPAYTLLLYLFCSQKKLDDDFYKKTITFLGKYFIRRNITDFPNTRNLDKIFMDLIEEFEKDKSRINYTYITKFLTDESRFSSLTVFKEKLEGDVYELNIDATRYILSKIEATKKTKEIHTDFWARDNSNKLIWTIEHIFPEGENIPQEWVHMMANGDKDKAKEIQLAQVHKFGNLTLTGYNSNLSNLLFEKKRDRKDKKGNNIGYKNGLFLNSDLKNKTTWKEVDIKKRTEKLVNIAIDIFKIENE